MAPIRRYLRINKYTVLELRIYLDNPALSETWLLRRNDPALPRIIAAIKPFVLPKLREETEWAQKAGKKKKSNIRSDVKQDDFEVSFYLIRQTSPHSLLTKHKDFAAKPRVKSNSNKLTSWLTTTAAAGTSEAPISVDGTRGEEQDSPIILREENDDENINMEDIPEADAAADEDDEDALFVDRSKPVPAEDPSPAEPDADVKKKFEFTTNYQGFSIYGHILCLIVKRVGPGTPRSKGAVGVSSSSQQMMENWVGSQAQREADGLIGVEE